jgi:hypothetical protein
MKQNHILTRWWHSRSVRQTRRLASPRLWYRYFTAGRRGLPDFIIAGAQKAGTTSLFGYLEGHPQCIPSSTKEVHYFDKNLYRGEAWYRMHFPPTSRAVARNRKKTLSFESSPYYMCEPRVPARMKELLPNVKLIFLLRNPVTRAYSHYQHSVLRRREPLSFEEAIEAEANRLAGEEAKMLADPTYPSFAYQHFSYLLRGIYVDQLIRWREHYAPEQMLVLEAERMFQQPAEVFAQVLQFLEVESWRPVSFENLNSGRYKEPMQSATRAKLEAYFAPHNQRLYDFLGWRTSWEMKRAA